jgi:hypothetical protein
MRSASERTSITPPVLTYVSLRMRPMTTSFPSEHRRHAATRVEAMVPGRADLWGHAQRSTLDPIPKPGPALHISDLLAIGP